METDTREPDIDAIAESRHEMWESEKQEARERGISVRELRELFKLREQDDSWLLEAKEF